MMARHDGAYFDRWVLRHKNLDKPGYTTIWTDINNSRKHMIFSHEELETFTADKTYKVLIRSRNAQAHRDDHKEPPSFGGTWSDANIRYWAVRVAAARLAAQKHAVNAKAAGPQFEGEEKSRLIKNEPIGTATEKNTAGNLSWVKGPPASRATARTHLALPRRGMRALGLIVPKEEREAVLGDLQERFHKDVAEGLTLAEARIRHLRRLLIGAHPFLYDRFLQFVSIGRAFEWIWNLILKT